MFYKFNPQRAGNTNFEDSYEYIRLYFDNGEWKGYRFHDGESLVYFAMAGSSRKPEAGRFKIFKPLGSEPVVKLKHLVGSLKQQSKNQVQVVCLPAKVANKLQGLRKKQFRYLVFDVKAMEGLKGQKWKNVRQKITRFERENRSVRVETLREGNYRKVVHFVSKWRREALDTRGFSYAQVRKAKFAAKYYADKIDRQKIWGYVYFTGGKVSAFQLLYRISDNAAANPIGLSDVSIDGLAEYSQVHAWTQAQMGGIKYINDGPSWRRSLEKYKRKFNPVKEQIVIETYI